MEDMKLWRQDQKAVERRGENTQWFLCSMFHNTGHVTQEPHFNFRHFIFHQNYSLLRNQCQNCRSTLWQSLHYLGSTFSPSPLCYLLFRCRDDQNRAPSYVKRCHVQLLLGHQIHYFLHLKNFYQLCIAYGGGRGRKKGGSRDGRCNLPQFDLIQLCQIALAGSSRRHRRKELREGWEVGSGSLALSVTLLKDAKEIPFKHL